MCRDNPALAIGTSRDRPGDADDAGPPGRERTTRLLGERNLWVGESVVLADGATRRERAGNANTPRQPENGQPPTVASDESQANSAQACTSAGIGWISAPPTGRDCVVAKVAYPSGSAK